MFNFDKVTEVYDKCVICGHKTTIGKMYNNKHYCLIHYHNEIDKLKTRELDRRQKKMKAQLLAAVTEPTIETGNLNLT